MPHEQVGKAGLAVPTDLLESAPEEVTLHEGDVLYVPRGFVHEVRAKREPYTRDTRASHTPHTRDTRASHTPHTRDTRTIHAPHTSRTRA